MPLEPLVMIGPKTGEAYTLQDAVFRQCDLRGADLSTAYGFRIDPEENRMEGARFDVQGALTLLLKYGVVVE